MGEASFQTIALPGVPHIKAGDDIPNIILEAMTRMELKPQTGDIFVVASKIISKSEGRTVILSDVDPDEEALHFADVVGKDPRIVQLILSESRDISRMRHGVFVTEHLLGFVSANAGLDASNVNGSSENVLLLPANPDQSAREICQAIKDQTSRDVAVVITDTHGRPFRLGNVGVAIGIAGMQALWDRRGEKDLFGREMVATILGYGDLVASAAHLVMGEGAEGLPIVLIRGLNFPQGDGSANDLNRPPKMDLYR